ncbi:hypothetical protein [Pseudoalteromonas ruthenica]|uniref:hypothetical protein n=1 Tax=Pseudoalteromonas ruthenica TaxID=151081 RepID=UPI00241CD0DB|nr:hypothetical protein [Pseudoalteromonas ruthenica]|tara:strand:+ start:51910 stop:52149 length:240 start_codon:yes stop_codon:yes gene_type:complete
MSQQEKVATWLMLVISCAVFIAATYTIGSLIGSLFITATIEPSILQIGIICGGITAISVFMRCVKKLKNNAELARTSRS